METRGGGCLEVYETKLYTNGVEISYPKKEFGCSGDVITFSVTSNMPEPLTYLWSLDGLTNVLGTNPTLHYTFDNTKHTLYCVVTSTNCAIGKTITVTGMDCVACATECVTQTAIVPEGELVSLIDFSGKVYKIDGKIVTSCLTSTKENKLASKAILRTIVNALKCKAKTLTANVYANQVPPSCISVVINNSPIKFKQIKVGSQTYGFNTSKC